MYAYFPIEWNFGKTPGDGFGGPVVDDAGTIYIVAEEFDEDFIEPGTIVCRTALDDLIENVIEGADSGGVIGDQHIKSCEDLRDALRKAADILDAALPK